MRQSILLVCATVVGATLACQPEEPRRAPAAAKASPTSGGYNPYATIPAGAIGAAPTATAPGNTGQGLGCGSADAEPVPKDSNEQAMRACCDKLMTANACQGSACWAKGVIESVRKAMEPGGKCAQ